MLIVNLHIASFPDSSTAVHIIIVYPTLNRDGEAWLHVTVWLFPDLSTAVGMFHCAETAYSLGLIIKTWFLGQYVKVGGWVSENKFNSRSNC